MPNKKPRPWKIEQLGIPIPPTESRMSTRTDEKVKQLSGKEPSEHSAENAFVADGKSILTASKSTTLKELPLTISVLTEARQKHFLEKSYLVTCEQCNYSVRVAISLRALTNTDTDEKTIPGLESVSTKERKDECRHYLRHVPSADINSLLIMTCVNKDAKSATPPLPGAPEKTLLRAVLSTLTSEEQAVLTSRVRQNVQSYLAKLGTTSTRVTHQPDTEEL